MFINDEKTRLGQLLVPIAQWYNELPWDKKWLLGGVSMGVETDIGGNYYIIPNGVNPEPSRPGVRVYRVVHKLDYAAISKLGLTGGVTRQI